METKSSKEHKKRLSTKFCTRCMKKPKKENITLCEECSEKTRKGTYTRENERRMLNLCVKCGNEDERTIAGKSRCLKCAIKESIARKERLKKKGIEIKNRLKY